MSTSVFPPHTGVTNESICQKASQRWPLGHSAALVFGTCGLFWVCLLATLVSHLG
jgi:hypothetical protein